MRTTIDISDKLAIRAKQAAAEQRTSLKSLVEEGLKLVLARNDRAPLQELKGLGKHVWEDIDPNSYVREQREGWS